MSTGVGHRFDLPDLPRQAHPPLRLLAAGWTEELSATDWTARINADPYDPYEVSVSAADDGSQDVLGQAVNSDYTTLADPIGAAATVLPVLVNLAGNPLRNTWTTDPADWNPALHGGPLLLDIGGEHMRVTDIAAPTPVGATAQVRDVTSRDAFAPSFNVTAPDMEPGDVVVAFQTADLEELGDQGTPTGGTPWTLLAQVQSGDRPTRVWGKVAGASEPAVYGFTQSPVADGVVIIVSIANASLPSAVTATNTQVGSGSTVATPGVDLPGAANVELRFPSAAGNPTWSTATGWTLQAQAASGAFVSAAVYTREIAGGSTGTVAFTMSSSQGERAAVTVAVDSAAAAVMSQNITVVRAANGVSKPHAAGAPVHVAHPAVVGL